MIKSLRWRLTFTSVALSSLVCLVLALIGLAYLYNELTSSIDEQLRVMTSQIGFAVDLKDNVPYFRNWKRVAQTTPARSVATIQLYSVDGRLLEAFGPKGVPSLAREKEARFDGKTLRIRSTPLLRSGKVVGYLQMQMSTRDRDEALREFAVIIAGLAPLLLLGLGVSSYFVSGKAVQPLVENIENMRSFLSDAGHELNTPLAIIRARAEALERKLERQNIDASDVKVISSSAERTTRLAADFMLLAAVEGNRAPRSSDQVALDSLVRQVAQDFSDRFQQKGISLKLVGAQKGYVWASSDDLYRAIANLLENALRYTECGGTVKVELKSGDGLFFISVQDSGIGIPPENLPFIFERFYRIDKSRSRASGGSGLGLAIVKAIVEAHGGGVSVASKVGIGSTFTLTLPGRTAGRASLEVHENADVPV
jgi:signal transduction histidine kinase